MIGAILYDICNYMREAKIWIEDDNIYKQACTPITISGVLLMKNQRHVHDFLRIQYLCTSGVHCKMALEL